MEINRLTELLAANADCQVQPHRSAGRPCIYNPETCCSIPHLKYRICGTCPRAEKYVRKDILLAFLQKVRELATDWIKKADILTGGAQTTNSGQTGNGAAAGSGGAGGASGGGMGGGA